MHYPSGSEEMKLTWLNAIKFVKIWQVILCLSTGLALYFSITGLKTALADKPLTAAAVNRNSMSLYFAYFNAVCALYSLICLLLLALIKRLNKGAKIFIVFGNQVAAVLITAGLTLFHENGDYNVLLNLY